MKGTRAPERNISFQSRVREYKMSLEHLVMSESKEELKNNKDVDTKLKELPEGKMGTI